MCAFVYFSNEHGGFCYCIDKDHLSILVNALERLSEEVHLLLDIQIMDKAFCVIPLVDFASFVIQESPWS